MFIGLELMTETYFTILTHSLLVTEMKLLIFMKI